MPVKLPEKEKRMLQALHYLSTHPEISKNSIARQFQLPLSTFKARAAGRLTRHNAHVDQQRCTPGEESALIRWCQDLSAGGYPVRLDMLREMGEYLLNKRVVGRWEPANEDHISLGIHWPRRFLARSSCLKAVLSKTIDHTRSQACTRDNFQRWFDAFHTVIQQHQSTASDIYNIDETGFRMGDTGRQYVIVDNKTTGSTWTSEEKGEALTVVECVCADGTLLPPFIIFKGKHIQSTWLSSSVPDNWMASVSPKGWTSNYLGLRWLIRNFEPNTREKAAGRQRILILDGHGSHLTPPFVEFCDQHKISILCMPAHTSHRLQPLDVSVFASLKHWYRRETDSRMRVSHVAVPKAAFIQIYEKARPKALTVHNVQSGFRKTGLIPYAPGMVIRQLPICRQTPEPDISIPSDLLPQTPRTTQDLHQMAAASSLIKLGALNLHTQAQLLDSKMYKGAEIAYNRLAILERDHADLIEFHETHRKGKRKKIVGGCEMTMGEMKRQLNDAAVVSSRRKKPPAKKQKTRAVSIESLSTCFLGSETTVIEDPTMDNETVYSCIVLG
jgi:DDE superfamily endonuclease